MVQRIRTAVLVMFLALLVGAPLAPVFEYAAQPQPVHAQSDPAPNSSQQSPQDETNMGTGTSSSEPALSPEANEEPSDIDFSGNCSQSIGVLSWIICPVLNFANELSSRFANYIIDLLSVEPLLVGTDDARNEFLYSAWSQFRNLANVLLVIVFLILIYLQLTGNQAYMVQRTLPRFVIAAVLLQFSYFFGAIIIDIGNVLAAGMAGIFNEVNNGILASSPDAVRFLSNGDLSAGAVEALLEQNIGQVNNIGDSLSGGFVQRSIGASIGFALLIFLLISIAVTTFFPPLGVVILLGVIGFVIAFLALILRQMGIVLFVVLSPLAFLAMALPGTEKIFREWVDNLAKLVLIYPLVVLLFSISSTLSLLALGTGQSEANQLVAAAIPVLVLFLIPTLFRLAGSLFRGGIAFIAGKGKQLGQGALGDYRDPGSFKSNARIKSLTSREKRAKQIAGMGQGRGGKYIRTAKPLSVMAQKNALAGPSVEGMFNPKHPDTLKRFLFGEKPFVSMDGSEDWPESDIRKTDFAKHEISTLKRSAPKSEAVASTASAWIGGHFDRGLDSFYGIGRQVKDGYLAPDVGESMFSVIQGEVKGTQRHLGAYSWSDLTRPDVTSPRGLYELGYGDLDPSDSRYQRNLEIKKKLLPVSSGTLMEQQSEGSWRGTAAALKDNRIRNMIKPKLEDGSDNPDYDNDLRNRATSAIMVGQRMNAKIGALSEQDKAILQAQQERGDEEVTVGGFYGKSGNEMKAMRHFIKVAEEAAKEIGFDPSVVVDPDEEGHSDI